MTVEKEIHAQSEPILLYDGGCAVCRRAAHWVETSATTKAGERPIILRPVGNDPEALRLLNPELNIWDAYETNYLIMTDGSMKHGGEAVAEVLRILPNTWWFSWCFAVGIFGFRPFQMLLNIAYAILDDVRPIFGCESCGTPSLWIRPINATIKWITAISKGRVSQPTVRATSRLPAATPMSGVSDVKPPPAPTQP